MMSKAKIYLFVLFHVLMNFKCFSFNSHFVYKCIKYSNFHCFFFSSLSLSLSFVRTKKKLLFFKEKRENDDEDDDGMKCILLAEKVWREQGRAPRVTNLIPSSNQSMCTGMPDAKENDCMDIRVAWSFRIYWTRLKARANERSQSSDLVCVYDQRQSQGHLSCDTNAKVFFFILTEHISI